jgi:hypothetical protein
LVRLPTTLVSPIHGSTTYRIPLPFLGFRRRALWVSRTHRFEEFKNSHNFEYDPIQLERIASLF